MSLPFFFKDIKVLNKNLKRLKFFKPQIIGHMGAFQAPCQPDRSAG